MRSFEVATMQPVPLEGDTPAPVARIAALAHHTLDSPFGPLLLVVSDRGLVRLALPAEDHAQVLERLPTSLFRGTHGVRTGLDEAGRQIDEYLRGLRRTFALALDWSLTGGFARRVLEAATRIPYGEVVTYAQLAAVAGSPRAARAAGRALSSNPVPIVVPCHRVVPAAGGVGGYAGGPETKTRLLELEGVI